MPGLPLWLLQEQPLLFSSLIGRPRRMRLAIENCLFVIWSERSDGIAVSQAPACFAEAPSKVAFAWSLAWYSRLSRRWRSAACERTDCSFLGSACAPSLCTLIHCRTVGLSPLSSEDGGIRAAAVRMGTSCRVL